MWRRRGRYLNPAPAFLMTSRTRGLMCSRQLSITTMSPRLSIGHRHCSRYARNISPVMAPSKAIGAVILSCRIAAMKVIVCQVPSGTRPITLIPRGARPLSRTMLVVTAVSSRNTSLAGSSSPCSRIQRRRARATSARSRSAACRLFFKGDVVPVKKARQRAAAGSNATPSELFSSFFQGQVRLVHNHRHYAFRLVFEWRNAAASYPISIRGIHHSFFVDIKSTPSTRLHRDSDSLLQQWLVQVQQILLRTIFMFSIMIHSRLLWRLEILATRVGSSTRNPQPQHRDGAEAVFESAATGEVSAEFGTAAKV